MKSIPSVVLRVFFHPYLERLSVHIGRQVKYMPAVGLYLARWNDWHRCNYRRESVVVTYHDRSSERSCVDEYPSITSKLWNRNGWRNYLSNRSLCTTIYDTHRCIYTKAYFLPFSCFCSWRHRIRKRVKRIFSFFPSPSLLSLQEVKYDLNRYTYTPLGIHARDVKACFQHDKRTASEDKRWPKRERERQCQRERFIPWVLIT